jgi:hypothetical protein
MAQIILDSNSNLIQGDFDAATVNNRTKLQTTTTNATTGVYVVPNGSATSASIQMSNAADPTNASKLVVSTNGATDTQIVSGANGTGSYLPLSFYTNNDIRFQMGTTGELNVRTAPGTVSSGTSGQFLTSGGPGAGVSWTTAAGGFSNMQVFTSPGTFTTPATTTKIKVTVVGGGGSGAATFSANNGSGGGGGGTAIYVGPVTASTPYAVTVGAGGAGVPAGTTPATAGNPGGTSSFTTLASATGGSGGAAGGAQTLGGAGGAGSAGTLQFTGGAGGNVIAPVNTNSGTGFGGSSFLAGITRATNSQPGNQYGGGSSGFNTASAGSSTAGAGGVVIVEY